MSSQGKIIDYCINDAMAEAKKEGRPEWGDAGTELALREDSHH